MRCVYVTGIEDRVYNNAVGIIASIINIGKGLFQDRTCQTNDELVEAVASHMHNIGELSAWISGFDKKWDSDSTDDHVTFSEFKDEIWDWYND